MRVDSKTEEFQLVEDEIVIIDNLIDEAQSLLNWVSPSKYITVDNCLSHNISINIC